jgi:hypothetical protein
LVLITLFAITIGPLNYMLLRKKKRLYLLLVTVPLGAGIVIFALLNYALISDGLGVRVRVRSYTHIDQRTGRSVSWSRQTYYAGLAPSRGLVFPADAVVLPVVRRPAERRGVRRAREVVWGEQQKLVSGYLQSRSVAQFLVVRSRSTEHGLKPTGGGDGAGLPQLRNDLAVPLEKLLVRDDQGAFFWAEQVDPGQSFQPRRIAAAKAQAELRAVYDARYPAYPPGYERSAYAAFGARRYYANLSEEDRALPDVQFSQGMLERSLNRKLVGDLKSLPARSYLAVARGSPGVPLGVRAARREQSFDVIFGRW